jgi:hypothetical protein
LLGIEFADAGDDLTHGQMMAPRYRGALNFPGFPDIENKGHGRVGWECHARLFGSGGSISGTGHAPGQFGGADLVHFGIDLVQ